MQVNDEKLILKEFKKKFAYLKKILFQSDL